MTRTGMGLIGAAGALCFCLNSSPAIEVDSVINPYAGIITNRNVFQLRTPPPPKEADETPQGPPPPKILLTGITTILGEPLALLKCTPPAAKGEQTKEKYYTLSIGEREDEIEVRRIDVEKGMVEVNDYGTITNLTFEKDGVKTAGSPAPNGGPRNNPNLPQPTPFNPASRTIPQRPMRGFAPGGRPGFSGGGDASQAGGMAMGGTAPAAGGGAAGLSMNLGGASVSLTGGPQQSGQPIIAGQDLQGGDMADDAYAALLEVQRQVTSPDVQSGKMPPLPITRFTPAGALGTMPEENTGEPDTAGSPASGATTTSPSMPLPGRPRMPY